MERYKNCQERYEIFKHYTFKTLDKCIQGKTKHDLLAEFESYSCLKAGLHLISKLSGRGAPLHSETESSKRPHGIISGSAMQ